MSFEELVQYITTHHDSVYLVPLSEKIPAGMWIRAMREAWVRMGLVDAVGMTA
jgi:hypothetical protein